MHAFNQLMANEPNLESISTLTIIYLIFTQGKYYINNLSVYYQLYTS
jgi:hypothetical protein